jgi:hypothetical protein
MMSFTSRELMIDVLPAGLRLDATAQPAPCEPATAGTGAGTEEEEDDLKCSPATAGDPTGVRMAPDLAMLRHQLREVLTLEQAARS